MSGKIVLLRLYLHFFTAKKEVYFGSKSRSLLLKIYKKCLLKNFSLDEDSVSVFFLL